MLTLRLVAQEKEQTSATNKLLKLNTECDRTLRPLLPPCQLVAHHVSRVPVVLLNLYLIEVAIDSTSPHFIPCRIQDERTAEKQQSRLPPRP